MLAKGGKPSVLTNRRKDRSRNCSNVIEKHPTERYSIFCGQKWWQSAEDRTHSPAGNQMKGGVVGDHLKGVKG